ncbi:MAG: methyltransferase family protein [Planctomycetota bacterium]
MHRVVALLLGALCHGSFALGVGAMVIGLYSGMTHGFGTLTGASAWIVDLLLVCQFPLLHSWMLSQPGRRVASQLAGRWGGTLFSTIFATFASWQLLVTFCAWSPLCGPRWTPSGSLFVVSCVAYALSWVLLGQTMLDAGLASQTGAMGWWALFRGRKPKFGPLPTQRTFAFCRQPVYFAYALTLWTGPTWSLDRLVLAVVWTGYCVLGPLRKEARYVGYHGELFREYQRRVPYFVPWLRRASG